MPFDELFFYGVHISVAGRLALPRVSCQWWFWNASWCGGARPDMHRTPACRNPGAWHCAATANPKLARVPNSNWPLKASGRFRKRDREDAGAIRNALNPAQEPVPYRGRL